MCLWWGCAAVSAQDTVLLGAEDDWAPYSSATPDRRTVEGLAPELVTAAFDTQGVHVTFKVLPFARCMLHAERGLVAGCFNATRVTGNQDLYCWHPTPLFQEELAIFGPHSYQATRELGVADLEGKRVGVTLRFWVCDTGIGMTPTQMEALFQPYTQASGGTARQYGGTGLGLAISQRLLDLMGGRIAVSSQEGAGSTFSVDLVLPVDPSAPAVSYRTGVPEGTRLLVVDDHDGAREVLASQARSLGFQVDVACSGSDALDHVRVALMARRPYRIVLLDCAMPGMDGIECAQRLTELGGEVPTVLMVTGFARDEVLARLRTLEATVRMVLTKPVTPSTLHDACLGVLNDRTEAAPAPRRASGIDFEHHRTVLEGTHVLLVEDNEINQELAVDLLSRVGVRVTVASRGEQALELLAQHPVDGVLMDCQMPGMDGYETTRRIRAHAPWQGLPVIAMTANVMQGDREKALLSGMNDHVGKPIDVDELYRVLARWLTPAAEAPGVPVLQGVTTLDALGAHGVDVQAGLARTLGNDALYRRMLTLFAQQERGFVPAWREAMARMDERTLRRMLHTMMGLAETLGATEVQSACDQLGQALNRGTGHPDMSVALVALDAALSRMFEGIERMPMPG